MNETRSYGIEPVRSPRGEGAVLLGLLWNDWRRHRAGIVLGVGFLGVVLAVEGAVVPRSVHTFALLVLVMAGATGLGLGRAEWAQGEEEFSLALPPRRADRYWVRFVLGLAVLASIYVIGLLTCFTELPSAVAQGLGLSLASFDLPPAPAWAQGPGFLALVTTASIALYAEAFSASMAVERPREMRANIEFAGFLVFAAVVYGVAWIALGAASGWWLGGAALVFSALRLRAGERAYVRKEAVFDAAAGNEVQPRTALLLVILGGLTLMGGLATWLWFSSR